MSYPPRSHCLRAGRYSETGRIYLVTSTTENRTPVFKDFYLGRLLVHELRHMQLQGKAISLAWVIMPDHFHWLLELRDESLSELIKQVKGRSSISVNRSARRSGPLWQSGYHDRALRREEDLLAAARYVITNPVRAGLVKRVSDYPLWDACWI